MPTRSSGDASARGRATALSPWKPGAAQARPTPSTRQTPGGPQLSSTGPLALGSRWAPGRPLRAWTPHQKDHWAGSLQSDSPPPESGVLTCPPTPVIKFRPTEGFLPPSTTCSQRPMIPSSLPTSPWACVPLRTDKINFHPDPKWSARSSH